MIRKMREQRTEQMGAREATKLKQSRDVDLTRSRATSLSASSSSRKQPAPPAVTAPKAKRARRLGDEESSSEKEERWEEDGEEDGDNGVVVKEAEGCKLRGARLHGRARIRQAGLKHALEQF